MSAIAPRSVIRWSDRLRLGIGFLDRDQEQAVAHLNRMAALSAGGGDPAGELDAFVGHCRDRFARETAMMARTGFFATDHHTAEHERVLAELGGVLTRLRAGQDCRDYFVEDLPQWFLEHHATMDMVTADFARERGWGPDSQVTG